VPWKESCRFMERTKFVLRLEEGERMVDLCREFGISRKTGYKLWERYKRFGAVGLFDESRKPLCSPQRMSKDMQELLLGGRKLHPTWGPKKVRAWLAAKQPGLKLPAPSSIGDLFRRNGLVTRRRRPRFPAPYGTSPLEQATAANDVWCADFKGQFKLGNGKTFSVVAENLSPTNVYIAEAMWNGKPYRRSWFTHEQLMAGGTLNLRMTDKPTRWDTGDPPPSMSDLR